MRTIDYEPPMVREAIVLAQNKNQVINGELYITISQLGKIVEPQIIEEEDEN